MVVQTLKDVTVDRVASEFQKHIEDRDDPIETIAAEIRHAGKIYRNLEEIKIPKIDIFLKRMKVMERSAVIPLLIWLYTSEVPLEQRLKSIHALESYLVRQMLCGFKSYGLSQFFTALLEKLSKESMELVDRIIINHLISHDDFNRTWPDNHMLQNSLVNQPMRGRAPCKKMILEAVEMSLRSDKSEPLGATDQLNIEHIMPKKWESHWKLPTNVPDGTEAEADRNETIKTIGNLTLTRDKLNPSLSNGPWVEKQKTLDTYSRLFLNKLLLETAPDIWDEAAIRERSQWLVERIVRIWPSPGEFTATSA